MFRRKLRILMYFCKSQSQRHELRVNQGLWAQIYLLLPLVIVNSSSLHLVHIPGWISSGTPMTLFYDFMPTTLHYWYRQWDLYKFGVMFMLVLETDSELNESWIGSFHLVFSLETSNFQMMFVNDLEGTVLGQIRHQFLSLSYQYFNCLLGLGSKITVEFREIPETSTKNLEISWIN